MVGLERISRHIKILSSTELTIILARVFETRHIENSSALNFFGGFKRFNYHTIKNEDGFS